MSRKKILIIGAGDHAGVICGVIRLIGKYEICGLVLENEAVEKNIDGIEVIGHDRDLMQLFNSGITYAAIGIGSVKNNSSRNKMFRRARCAGFTMINVIHPSVILSSGVNIKVNSGCQILAGTVVGNNVTVAPNTVIYSGCIIEHNTVIGADCYIAPGVIVSGNVKIETNCFIGTGTTVIEKINIGANAVVGAGSVVVKDIPGNVLAYGVPARVVKDNYGSNDRIEGLQ